MVVLSTSAIPSIRMTVDEYLAADLPEGTRYELVDGVVEMSPVPELPHDLVLSKLRRVLDAYSSRRPDLISHISLRSAVALTQRRTAREPDLSAYSEAEFSAALNVGKSWKDMRPALVVEVVSQGQRKRDYETKRQDYWDAGLPEYWIVDPQRRTLTALTRGPEAWIEAVYDDRATFRPGAFAGLEIRIAELFTS